MRVPPSQSKTDARRLFHRLVRAAALQGPGDAGQAGAEAEDLDPGVGPPGRVGELQEVPRVVRHGAGHVQDEDQWAQAQAAAPPVEAGGLPVGAQGLADGAAQVGPGATLGPHGSSGTAAGWGEADLGHDPAQRGQLVGGAGGEGLLAQELGIGRHEAESGLLLVALLGVGPGIRDLQGRLGERLGPDGAPDGVGLVVALVEEEAPEHPVVGGDLVPAGHQGGPARPVEVDDVGRVERLHRRAVGEQVAGPDRQTGRTEGLAEVDQHADERRLLDGGVSHRRRARRGAPAPHRGRRAP